LELFLGPEPSDYTFSKLATTKNIQRFLSTRLERHPIVDPMAWRIEVVAAAECPLPDRRILAPLTKAAGSSVSINNLPAEIRQILATFLDIGDLKSLHSASKVFASDGYPLIHLRSLVLEDYPFIEQWAGKNSNWFAIMESCRNRGTLGATAELWKHRNEVIPKYVYPELSD
jgi:hypothetical protein